MRRRADQADAGRAVADAGNRFIDLVARQLAAFAGLRALSHLDLQFVGVGEVVDRDAEAARCHLLDRRALAVTVRQRLEAFWVFAALARIAPATHAIHGDRQSLVRFG